ncbi:MAG TPA: sensory rhodopsin transducer [Rectinema sp.]|nr:sensory rhodopsin transducer [Rectinema sp.]
MKDQPIDKGKKQWVYPDLELPPPGDFPLKGHESLIILNMNDSDASIIITLYFTDKEPISLPALTVKARRVRCLRLDKEEEIGIQLPRETQYALRLNADVPVVAQYGRLDTRQQNMAFYTVMGYSG